MIHVVLFEPEIPPNTGNIIRLCANTGARLHLVHPLGFRLDDRQLRRAGLDYHEYASITEHASLEACLATFASERTFAVSTRGARAYHAVEYRADDAFVFGAETRGLPPEARARFAPENILRIPMRATSRSMNLGNAASVIVYEAWRQLGFSGAQ